ncbi:MAG TPA: Gfo/Idh/MocA family oxidoreductase [Lachnospiraceae bacterium]|nr:Gfo/Idh/MocA family oxidoreductase [Lachnospiraceae bacterium]
MKVLFTAVGSIGTRHVGNLTKVCQEKGIELTIDVIRYSERSLTDDLRKMVRREIRSDQDIDENYDVVFITDETKTHYDNIVKFKNRCKHMFIEKPIFDNTGYNIKDVTTTDNSIYYVACPIRFTDYYKILKDAVSQNEVYSARIIFSSYMPNWQKGRDYRKSFRCFSDRGGGVDIDSLHEIDYMTGLFGFPEDVKREAGHYSNIEMDAPDIADYIFRYKDKLVEMHLDYFGRTNNRRVELFCKDDVIVIDFNKKTVTWEKKNQTESFEPDGDFYVREMRYFVELIFGNKERNINTVENAFQNLKLAKGQV